MIALEVERFSSAGESPMSWDELRSQVENGKVVPQDRVRIVGGRCWHPVTDFSLPPFVTEDGTALASRRFFRRSVGAGDEGLAQSVTHAGVRRFPSGRAGWILVAAVGFGIIVSLLLAGRVLLGSPSIDDLADDLAAAHAAMRGSIAAGDYKAGIAHLEASTELMLEFMEAGAAARDEGDGEGYRQFIAAMARIAPSISPDVEVDDGKMMRAVSSDPELLARMIAAMERQQQVNRRLQELQLSP